MSHLFLAVSESITATDAIWILVGIALVFFMQAGFAMVETGLTRAKNAGNIIMKNLMDFCIGGVVFWLLGYGLMQGADNFGLFGTPVNPFGEFDWLHLMFHMVFCATASTIVSGAMAERTKFSSYCIYSLIISMVVYPISGHWIWGGGWLAQLGFIDFAGSTAVHMVGGIAALIGAKILGARIGKYGKDGKPKAIPGHSMTLAALGVFILFFGWYGFNGASQYAMTTIEDINAVSNVFVTTSLAACLSTITAMIITWIKYKKPDVSMTLNGTLAGLVAITAGCASVNPLGAAIIGIVAGFVVVFGIEFIDKVVKIDDPVGAIGVHGMCGATGTILVGLFAVDGGVFYGGGFTLLGVQTLGVISVAGWVVITMIPVFLIIKKTVGLRVPAIVEIEGLDKTEHGLISSYADFMPSHLDTFVGETSIDKAVTVETVSVNESDLPTEAKTTKTLDKPITKLVVIMNQIKFEAFKSAMSEIGVNGMTVTNVLGYGMQKGSSEYYRGAQVEAHLLPKIKVEIVVCKVPVEKVIEKTKKALYTGHIGDGKIFVYKVENVIKVRTAEQGYDALQDD